MPPWFGNCILMQNCRLRAHIVTICTAHTLKVSPPRELQAVQYGEAKMIPLIFLEYFVKYLSMKGLMMFKLHMGVCEGECVRPLPPICHALLPLCTPKSSFLLNFQHYFAHFRVAMNVPTSLRGAKMCKIMLKMSKNNDFGFFYGRRRGKWVGVSDHTLPHESHIPM